MKVLFNLFLIGFVSGTYFYKTASAESKAISYLPIDSLFDVQLVDDKKNIKVTAIMTFPNTCFLFHRAVELSNSANEIYVIGFVTVNNKICHQTLKKELVHFKIQAPSKGRFVLIDTVSRTLLGRFTYDGHDLVLSRE